MKVLITGGSGYLGQFLICDLASKSHRVAFTYNSHAVTKESISWAHVSAHHVDLQTGEGLEECVQSLGTVRTCRDPCQQLANVCIWTDPHIPCVPTEPAEDVDQQQLIKP
jgi:NAD(P)-dependent dehydrogenase (short-subunit alcohol dehydrogenase family)